MDGSLALGWQVVVYLYMLMCVACCSLHKSLSQEADLRQNYSSNIDALRAQLEQRDHVIEQMQRENERLLRELDTLSRDKQALSDELMTSHDAHKHSAANERK